MNTTEKLFKEFLDEIERKIKVEFRHMPEATRKYLVKKVVKIIEEEARERIAIDTFPPRNFPVGLIHDDDYYDSELLAPQLARDTTFGWNGEV